VINGVAHVILPDDRGVFRRQAIGGLVLRAFVGPRPIGCEPFHFPDPDPLNNHVDNLRWAPIGTVKVGRDPLPGRHPDQRGDRNPRGRLTSEVIPLIREWYRAGSLPGDIAAELGVSDSAIRQVLKGITWSHIPDPLGPIVMRHDAARGEDVHTAKLDELAVAEIGLNPTVTLVANSRWGSPSRSLGRIGPPAKGTPRALDAPAEFATSVNSDTGGEFIFLPARELREDQGQRE
jgi:hypothetical protein